jgi:hypothetical protein
MINKFVIISRSRVGSNLLMTYLNNHPNIICDGEIIREAKIKGKNILERAKKCWDLDKVSGFKLFYYHTKGKNKEELYNYIKENNIKVIHLKRKNKLRTVISSNIAMKHGWHRIKSKKDLLSLEERRFNVSVDSLLKEIKKTEEMEKEHDKIFPNGLEVFYEEMNEIMPNVFNFLGVKNVPLKTDMIRQNPEKLSDIIINYDEVKKALESTKYKKYLKE